MGTTPSGLPEQVGDDEDLARFLTQSGHFNAKMAKPSAFLPSPNKDDPENDETSISRHGPAPVQRLWELGLQAAGTRKLYGAVIFKARAVRAVHLELLANEPPPRHAVIRKWPRSDDPDLQKALRKELALALASAAGPPLLGE